MKILNYDGSKYVYSYDELKQSYQNKILFLGSELKIQQPEIQTIIISDVSEINIYKQYSGLIDIDPIVKNIHYDKLINQPILTNRIIQINNKDSPVIIYYSSSKKSIIIMYKKNHEQVETTFELYLYIINRLINNYNIIDILNNYDNTSVKFYNNKLSEQDNNSIREFCNLIDIPNLYTTLTEPIYNIQTDCHYDAFLNLANNEDCGSVISAIAYNGCKKHNTSFYKLISVWRDIKQLLPNIVKTELDIYGPTFIMLYQHIVKEQFYYVESANFLYQMAVNRELNCSGSSSLFYALYLLYPDNNIVEMIVIKEHIFPIYYSKTTPNFKYKYETTTDLGQRRDPKNPKTPISKNKNPEERFDTNTMIVDIYNKYLLTIHEMMYVKDMKVLSVIRNALSQYLFNQLFLPHDDYLHILMYPKKFVKFNKYDEIAYFKQICYAYFIRLYRNEQEIEFLNYPYSTYIKLNLLEYLKLITNNDFSNIILRSGYFRQTYSIQQLFDEIKISYGND